MLACRSPCFTTFAGDDVRIVPTGFDGREANAESCWMRRSRGAAAGLLFVAVAGLTVGQPPASAQTEEETSEGGDVQTATHTGPAPVWPFEGIVALRSDLLRDPARERSALVYWDSETGALSEVVLDQGSWGTYCPGEFSANRHRVRYVWYAHSGDHLEFVVPWGDYAYPILHSESFVDFHTPADGSPAAGSAAGRLDVAMRYGVLRVDNSQETAYYRFPYDSDTGGHGLARVDSDEGERAFETEPDDEELVWGTSSWELGAAGFYYGFEVQYAEPACQAEDWYIVDGRTGELVACFHSYGGPSPVFVGPSALSELELPEPFADKQCDGFDLGRLGPSGAPGGEPG